MAGALADLRNAPRTSTVLDESPDIADTHFVDHRVYHDPHISQVETEMIACAGIVPVAR